MQTLTEGLASAAVEQPGDVGLLRDRYQPLAVLGRGGQGEVLKALDQQHNRVVALKIRPLAEADQRDIVLAEARILLTLRPHANLPMVREDFFWNDQYVLVMDYVEGVDLASLVLDTGDPGLPVSSVLGWLAQAASALDHLHGQGIIHGDVKPANLVLTPDGRIVLVDFGISHKPGDAGLHSLGSPGYAAPELSSGHLTSAADVYGLAATAVALLTGAPPSGGRPDWEGVPGAAAIERGVRRGLAVDPTRRPRSATELIERLRAHLDLDLPTGVVTFLLTDIEGSTVRWEDDPEGMGDLLATHDGLMADAVESHGGRLLKTRGEGDATFSVFSRASDAAAAALAGQQMLLQHTGLPVRMAIHTGEAETRDGDYFGRTVNRASRLRSVADGGQILLSAAAADLVVDALPPDATLIDLGFRELRDLSRGEQVFALTHPTLAGLAPASVPRPAPAWTGPERRRVPDRSSAPAPLPVDTPTIPPVAAPTVTLRPPQDGTPRQPPLPAALAAAIGGPFVGRAAETARLLATLDASRTGSRRLVLLSGEPGVGKTQLVAEIAARAHDSGAIVLHGRCDDGLQVPYQPFVSALSQLLEDASRAGEAPVLGRLAPELVRLVPDVAAFVGDHPPTHADPETEQYRLFDAVALWLQAMCRNPGGLVMVLDDLHWATPPTLHLLRHVLRTSEPLRLLVLATYRDTEIGRGHPLAELLADLHRLAGTERLTLRGLDVDGVADLLDTSADQPLGIPGRQLALRVHDLTDGNPFFTREVFRHLVETGVLARGEDNRWVVSPPAGPLGVPEGAREVIGRRLARLPEAAAATLELAAVIGVEFDLDVLVGAGGFDEEDVLAALDDAVAARLIEEAGALRFRFAHTIVRTTIIDAMSRARRSRAHRRVADAIEQLHQADLDAHLSELARHYAEAATAGEGTKAVEYSIRAGDLAMARLAHEEAVVSYRLANNLLTTTEAPIDEQRRCRLLLALGRAEQLSGTPGWTATIIEAGQIAMRWRDSDLLAAAALAASRRLPGPDDELDPERVALLRAALELGADAVDDDLRARLLAHLAVELDLGTDRTGRDQAAADALAIACRSDDGSTLAEVLVLGGPVAVEEQMAVTRRAGDPELEFHAVINAVVAAVVAGDTALADDRLARARKLADELDQPGLRRQVLVQEARLGLMAGRFGDAEALADEALELGRSAGHAEAPAVHGAQIHAIRWWQGRVVELLPLLVANAQAQPSNPRVVVAAARALATAGERDEARRWFNPLIDRGLDQLPAAHEVAVLAMAADTAVLLDDADRGRTILEVLEPRSGAFFAGRYGWGGPFSLAVGRLQALVGRTADAEASLRSAIAMSEVAGSPPAVEAARHALGRLDHPNRGPL